MRWSRRVGVSHNHNVKQSDDPIARKSIPPLASGHREETREASKTDEGAARPRRTLSTGE